MSPAIFRLVGLVCCIAAAVLGFFYFAGRPLWGVWYTPFLLFGVGALLLVRARFTKQ